jgi:hypothetical protein
MSDLPDYETNVIVVGTVTITGTVSITGTVTITGAVTITGTVTITGAVTITSGAVTISTVGGTNIIIDKLLQGSYLARAVYLSNDNGVVAPTAPPYSVTGPGIQGKFFPRGARGFLVTLEVYCKRTSSGTITINCAPNVGMGATYTGTITPSGSWGWQYLGVNKFWNYDSIFIWLSAAGADVSIGYDTTEPTDYYAVSDGEEVWGYGDFRDYMRAYITGESIGDLPVSGTINVIPIPSVVSASVADILTIAAAGSYDWNLIKGAGKLLYAQWSLTTDESIAALQPRIKVDDVDITPWNSVFTVWYANYVGKEGLGFRFGVYDTTNKFYTLICTVPIEFKRKLEIGIYYSTGSGSQSCSVGVLVSKIA